MIQTVREIWEENGGGFYAAGAVVTFVALEIGGLAEDLAEAGGVGPMLRDGGFEWMIGLGLESMMYAVTAVIWPVKWLEVLGPQWGVVAVGGAWGL